VLGKSSMSQFNMHSIKRAARKEAWYSDSWNPFRKTVGPIRASTWTTSSEPFNFDPSPLTVRDDPQLSGAQTENHLGTTNPDDGLGPSQLTSTTWSESHVQPVQRATPLKDVEKQHAEAFSEPQKPTYYRKFIAKAERAWLQMKTQSRAIEHETSDLNPQEFFRDPYGSLSEQSIEKEYRDDKNPPRIADGQRALNTTFSIRGT